MKININIKNKKHLKFLLIISKISFNILNNFIKKCPKQYTHIIPRLKSTPIEISVNIKAKNFYAQAYFTLFKRKLNTLTIEYSEELIKKNNRQLRLIAAHELAHSIDFLLRGTKNDFKHHDKEWQKLALLLKTQPTTTIDIRKKRGKIYS